MPRVQLVNRWAGTPSLTAIIVGMHAVAAKGEDMHRRGFLIGGATCLCSAHAAGSAKDQGCIRSAVAGDPKLVPVLASSGDKSIDELCFRETLPLVKHFNVNPHFGYYDDGSRENALADARRYDAGRPDGAVLLGLRFARKLMRLGEEAVIVILAHELGHIAQYKAKIAFKWSVRYELAADEAAGKYFRSRTSDEAVGERVARLFLEMGDNFFTQPNHHGTPNQRADMFRHGFGIATGIEVSR